MGPHLQLTRVLVYLSLFALLATSAHALGNPFFTKTQALLHSASRQAAALSTICSITARPVPSPPVSRTTNVERIILPFQQQQQQQQKQKQAPAPAGSQFVRDAVRNVGPSVVRIDCDREISPLMSLFSENNLKEGDIVKVSGTGIVVTTDGYILTNAHVIDNAKRVTISLSNGRTFKADVVASDEFTDLAVIKANINKEQSLEFPQAPLGDSSSLQAGDWVIAVGCPVGLDFTVTLGVVSSPKRSASEVGAPHLKGNYIQTDAALNSGNSGGPLVNDSGQVVGINTMVRTNTEAIGFAIPINRATEIYEVLKHGRKPTHAFFGLAVMPITPDNARIHNDDPNANRLPEVNGALVMNVVPGSPADLCGIRKNDVIVGVNGQSVCNSDEADTVMDRCVPGKPSKLLIVRGEGGQEVVMEAVPGDLLSMLQERRLKQGNVVVLKPGR